MIYERNKSFDHLIIKKKNWEILCAQKKLTQEINICSEKEIEMFLCASTLKRTVFAKYANKNIQLQVYSAV